MKLYLDNSFLNRPFDDQSISRNHIETQVLFEVLHMAASGRADIVNSAVVEYENSKNSNPKRKNFVATSLKAALFFQAVTPAIRDRAQHIEQVFGITPLDALHIASAEAADADVFLTCDRAIIKRYIDTRIVIMNPVTFFETYGDNNKT